MHLTLLVHCVHVFCRAGYAACTYIQLVTGLRTLTGVSVYMFFSLLCWHAGAWAFRRGS